jgi:CHAD domain-containing protein
MAYRFKTDEPLAKGFRRVVAEQLGAAEKRLRDTVVSPADIATQVHESRKNLKRTRALLRLLRPALGEAVFKRENARLRDVGQMLSRRRDVDVLDQTLAKLTAEKNGALASAATKLRSSMAAKRDGLDRPDEVLGTEAAAAELAQCISVLRRVKLDGEGFDLIRPGLKRCYGDCRRAFKEAYDQPSEETFHEWRKTIQHHWRQMLLLSKAWPEMLLPQARAARQISDLLGEEHDLALLTAYLAAHEDLPLTARERQRIEAYCAARTQELRALCQPLGERLLAESPGDHCRRMACYWETGAKIDAAPKQPEPKPLSKDTVPAEAPEPELDAPGKAA